MSVQYGLLSQKQLSAFFPLLPDNLQGASNLHFVGAVKEQTACGILAFRVNELVMDIVYLAVSESCRRQGIANGLLDFLCKNALEIGRAVLCTFSAPDQDDPFCRLLIQRGDFTLTSDDSYICRFPCKDLASVKLPKAPPHIEQFYKLPENIQREFFSHLKQHNAEQARRLESEKPVMLSSLCLCVVESGIVQSAVFCQNQDGDVLIAFAYSRPGHGLNLMNLLARLRELLVMAADTVPCFRLAAITEESRKLVDALLPRKEIINRFYTACWDMNTMGG